MSKKIGVVSEGVSDYRVIRHITDRFLKTKEGEEFFTYRLNPKEERNKQVGFGTWQGVFKYISNELIAEALEEGCEYVIVQIDTDVCNYYNVPHDLTNVETLWENVCKKLDDSVHPDFDRSKLIYAICIDELECWLIPFVDEDKKRCKNMDRCLNIVNGDIHKKGLFIDKDNKNSTGAQKAYDYILKQKKKPKEIKECSESNYGFKKFIEQLDSLAPDKE